MKTVGGETPEMSSEAISGMLLRKELALSMMGQRVLPQRKREPLQRTQRLFWLARAVIWLSASEERWVLLSRFCSQLSGEVEAEGEEGGTAYLVAVVMVTC